MAFIQNMIQKWSRVTLRNPDGFLVAAVLLFYSCSMGFVLLLAMIIAGLTHDVWASFNIALGVLLGAFGFGVARRPKSGGAPAPLLLKFLLGFTGAGTLAAIYLTVADFGALNAFWHTLGVYALIVFLGDMSGQGVRLFRSVLSSREQPFIMKMLTAGAGGVFLGALCFAFLFYSRLGVITSLLLVSWLSSLSALFLAPQCHSLPPGEKSSATPFTAAHIFAAMILFVYLLSVAIPH